MILHRLYELSVREGLLDDIAFERLPVPFYILIDNNGKYTGILDMRTLAADQSNLKAAEQKRLMKTASERSIPRAHGNTANQGFARYYADTLARVLPISEDEKSQRSRQTYWNQMRQAAQETNDPALLAIIAFANQMNSDPALQLQIKTDYEAQEAGPGDRCTFTWLPDRNKPITDRVELRAWYRQLYDAIANQKQQDGPIGLCQITGTIGPLPRTHSISINGIPGGLPTGVKMVSYDKSAFESYNLEGTANAGVGYLAADGYAKAINCLIANNLGRKEPTCFRLGKSIFLYWTRNPSDPTDFMALDKPEPAQVERLLNSFKSGKLSTSADAHDFYLLSLSGNSARAIVRDYLELSLSEMQANLGRWFDDLTIADIRREGAGKPTNLFPLWQLSQTTAFDSDSVAPDTPSRLINAALMGSPLPEMILAACLGRLRAEGSKGFSPARMALIKLTLLRRNIFVTATLSKDETKPAYVCGQLMALFEQIQYTALGDVNANVTDKFFGTMSAAPSMVLGRLFSNAKNHIRKLRGEKPKAAHFLDKQLAEVSAKLNSPPVGQLSLYDQGYFALGYYHQKAKRFEEIAEYKAAMAELETN